MRISDWSSDVCSSDLATLPASMSVDVLADRTTGIRASVNHVQIELLLAVVMVVLVIFFFLHSLQATIIASLAVPISLIGACGAMYLLGYSLNNLTLMALTIATGFVVDDEIVPIEIGRASCRARVCQYG